MAKIIAIATNLFEDSELTSPKKALEDAGHTVDVAENEANKDITGKHGAKVAVNKTIDQVNFNDYDALLIPGGFSPDQLRADQRYVNLVRSFLLSDKPVFAICHGPQLFIQSGLASALTLTAVSQVRNDLFYAGAKTKDQSVVVDSKHNLVTSRTPADLKDFNREAKKMLASAPVAG